MTTGFRMPGKENGMEPGQLAESSRMSLNLRREEGQEVFPAARVISRSANKIMGDRTLKHLIQVIQDVHDSREVELVMDNPFKNIRQDVKESACVG